MDGGGVESSRLLLLTQLQHGSPPSPPAGVGFTWPQEHCEPDEATAEITWARFKRPPRRFMCHEKEAAINFYLFFRSLGCECKRNISRQGSCATICSGLSSTSSNGKCVQTLGVFPSIPNTFPAIVCACQRGPRFSTASSLCQPPDLPFHIGALIACGRSCCIRSEKNSLWLEVSVSSLLCNILQ